jgi:glycosyltransferase involved in cell wall biosynthesis
MSGDLVVLGQDPRFGGGSAAQTSAFLTGAIELGRRPQLLYDEHPGLGEPRVTWRRIEALRQLAAARRLEAKARDATALWVVAALAQHGAAAPRTGRPYGCWVGTTIRAEWRGRGPGLPFPRRLAAGMSIPALAVLERRVLRGAARVYATSQSSRADVARVAGLDADVVGVLPIPVDVERLTPADDGAWREAAARPVLVFVGRADDPRKNVPMLLDAFANIRTAYPAARLRLVGKQSRGALPHGVEAVGEVGDVADELTRGAIFVLPSRQEGFGIVAAEAMAAGLPVVTTPSGGPEDLVRRSGGGTIAPDHSAPAFAETVLTVVRDPDRLEEMRRRGRAYVEVVHSPSAFRETLRTALAEVESA